MDSISYSAARSNLAQLMDKVCDDNAPVVITRQNARSVVLLSLADYEALQETAYLLRNPYNAARLAKSMADAEAGVVAEKDLID
jgi:antitoxin YefM